MILKIIENPRPIKLNESEQRAMDTIAENLWKRITSKAWRNSTAPVNTAKIFDEEVMVTTFGQKPRPLHIKVRGGKKPYNRYRTKGFGFTGGGLTTIISGVSGMVVDQKLEVYLNGYAQKNSFYQMYENLPFDFFKQYTGFLSTIRHEIIHAKDPIAESTPSYGTSGLRRQYGHLHYVNDPARVEIRSAWGEWDVLLSEVQNILTNKNADGYHNEVNRNIKAKLCPFIRKFHKAEDKSVALYEFLTDKSQDHFVPSELGNRLKLYQDFFSMSDRDAKKVAEKYEKAMKDNWTKKWREDAREYMKIKSDREKKRQKIIGMIKGRGWKNRGELLSRVKKIMDGKEKEDGGQYAWISTVGIKKLPKKPILKEKFTKKEIDNILNNREKNYRETIQIIYTLMKEKGLLSEELCTGKTELQTLQEKRAMTLLKKDKIVIQSLMDRFTNMESK